MTKRSPGIPGSHASVLSLRQQASPAVPTPTAPVTVRSTNFILADMDGRISSDNRACASCVARLSPAEIGQVDCHVVDGQACQLCQVAACKPEAFTKPFCDFLQENPTIFHTVAYFERKLDHAGFQELSARDPWTDKIRPGGKYWVTRNGSALVAFTVGKSYKPGNGVAMIAGHIDALTARLKPVSTRQSKAGFVQLGVAPYAGGLNPTWWDRQFVPFYSCSPGLCRL